MGWKTVYWLLLFSGLLYTVFVFNPSITHVETITVGIYMLASYITALLLYRSLIKNANILHVYNILITYVWRFDTMKFIMHNTGKLT